MVDLGVSFDPKDVRIGWDGSRTVKVNGKDMNLNSLASQIVKLSLEPKVDTLNVDQRKNGVRLVSLIREAYDESDRKIKNENIFLRALVWMRDGLFGNVSSEIREGAEFRFSSYSTGGCRRIRVDLEELYPSLVFTAEEQSNTNKSKTFKFGRFLFVL